MSARYVVEHADGGAWLHRIRPATRHYRYPRPLWTLNLADARVWAFSTAAERAAAMVGGTVTTITPDHLPGTDETEA